MRQMRFGFTGALLLLLPATSTAAEFSVQEALLRAKPAVALVVVEVGSEVLVTCGGRGEKVVRPAPFRETGTGWFVSPSGWMITNAHVVSAARLGRRPAGAPRRARGVRRAPARDAGGDRRARKGQARPVDLGDPLERHSPDADREQVQPACDRPEHVGPRPRPAQARNR